MDDLALDGDVSSDGSGSDSGVDSGSEEEVFALKSKSRVAESSSDDDDDDDDDSADEAAPATKPAAASAGAIADSDSDSDSGSEGEISPEEGMGWGTKRSTFYNADTATNQLEEEDALDEEKEALRLQKLQAEELSEEDFTGLTMLSASKKKTKGRKGTTGRKKGKGSDVDSSDDDDDAEGGLDDVGLGLDGDGAQKIKRRAGIKGLVAAQSPELIALLNDLKDKVADLQQRIRPVLQKVKAGELPTNHGVSFLEVKHQLLLNYLTNLTFYLLLKAEGKSVKDHPVMEHLHRIRTTLEKMRPLDAKLQHQVNKLLRLAENPDADRVAAKPRPGALVGLDEDEDTAAAAGSSAAAAESSGDESEGAAPQPVGVYKAPKRTAVLYDDAKGSRKAAREEERRRARLTKTEMFQGLLEELTDRPEVRRDPAASDAAVDRRLAALSADRERYEEENFVRMVMPRAEKKLRNKRERERMQFGSMGALQGAADLLRAAEAGEKATEYDSDDSFYKEAERQAALRKDTQKHRDEKRKSERAEAFAEGDFEDEDVDGDRRAGRDILKNKGLTKYRKKDLRNPRKHTRIRYEKAVKRRKGQVQDMRTSEAGNYGGEATGIRTTISKSHKIA